MPKKSRFQNVNFNKFFSVFHAIGYALWLISFNFNVLCNTILFYHSGITSLWENLNFIFRFKCVLGYLIIYPLSVSTGFTYFGYLYTCNVLFKFLYLCFVDSVDVRVSIQKFLVIDV
ncbi:unnamed protein product [Meloidogyne enterolobii]|uniref:Uncharacterized protein n=1 Tax=Meloidogyne enterolobii TaxID=390850 RepID=A0ACB1A6X8_MELEN